jgi:hypothetical protein
MGIAPIGGSSIDMFTAKPNGSTYLPIVNAPDDLIVRDRNTQEIYFYTSDGFSSMTGWDTGGRIGIEWDVMAVR